MGSQNVLPRLSPDKRSHHTLQSGVSARDPAQRSVTGGARPVSPSTWRTGAYDPRKAWVNGTGSLARSAEGGSTHWGEIKTRR